MTKNLFDLTYELASELGIVYESTVTGSTSTSAVTDTVMRTESDDHWNQGTLWLTYDVGGAAAAPQGEFSVVSDFDNATNTILLSTALSTATVATDSYAVANRIYPLYDLILAVNRALRDVGLIPVTNDTAIDTAAAQTEYTLPETNIDLREVWLELNASDPDDTQAYKVRNWYVQKEITGFADTLVFGEQPAYPKSVKLVYVKPHPKLVSSTDKLSEAVPYERVVYRAAANAMKHYMMKTHEESGWFEKALTDAQSRAAQADLMYPISSPKKMGKMLSLGYTKTRELAPGENKIT